MHHYLCSASHCSTSVIIIKREGFDWYFLAVTTCESPPSMPLMWDQQTIFDPFVGNTFTMPAHCIICNCAHHRPSKQPTFSMAKERAYHWNKCHRDILAFILKSGPAYLIFLQLMKCPSKDENISALTKKLHWPTVMTSTAVLKFQPSPRCRRRDGE